MPTLAPALDIGRGIMSPRDKTPNIREVDPSSFGGQLRRLRMDAGLTQEELGEAIGLNQQRISMYERGLHLPEREEVIIDLANALGVSPGTLFESSRFNGAIITSSERLKRLGERDWQELHHLASPRNKSLTRRVLLVFIRRTSQTGDVR